MLANGTSSGSRRAHLLRTGLHLTGAALIGLYLVAFAARNVSLQWDFKAYVLAARAALAGLDPYRLDHLSAIAGKPVPLPFLYPPVALVPFFPLAALPIPAAAALWIGAKSVLLAGLVFAWARWFAPRAGLLPIALVAVFGWNAAALWDLRAGNVALIECALLWAAFGCFVAGRRTAFAVLVVAAACFKLAPAAYLLLLLVPSGKESPSRARFALSLAALAALVWGPLVLGPAAHWTGFMRHIPNANDLGEANPSALAFASAAARTLGIVGPWATLAGTAAWAAYALALLGFSLPFLRRAWRARDERCWVMAAVFLDLLLAPRPMAYGFVRLAPAPLFFAPRPFQGPRGVLLLALILSAQGLARVANQHWDGLLFLYAPFLVTLAVWLLIVQPRS